MLQVSKNEPLFFKNAKKKVKNKKQSDAWNKIDINKNELRKYILTKEQESMCAYCEKKIDDTYNKSNTDHFKTRNQYPELTLEYSNLFVSCKSQVHCEYKKDNAGLSKIDFGKLISPLNNTRENFTYSNTGDILGENSDARFTSDIFALNHISLKEERKQIIRNFEAFKDFSEDEIFDTFKSHKSLISYLKNKQI